MELMGGSPEFSWGFRVTLPKVTSARCAAALVICGRSGTPKPNEVALVSARGVGGAGGAAACCKAEGIPVWLSGVRG